MFVKFNNHFVNLDQLVAVGEVDQNNRGDHVDWTFSLDMSDGIGRLSQGYEDRDQAEEAREAFITTLKQYIKFEDLDGDPKDEV